MYMSFYQHMQSVQYRQDLEHEIAMETVQTLISPFSSLMCVVAWLLVSY